MRTSMDEILRRLVLLGLPLAPMSCSRPLLQKLVDGSADVFVLNDASGGSGGSGGTAGLGGSTGIGGVAGTTSVGGAGGIGGTANAGGRGGAGGIAIVDAAIDVPMDGPGIPSDARPALNLEGGCWDWQDRAFRVNRDGTTWYDGGTVNGAFVLGLVVQKTIDPADWDSCQAGDCAQLCNEVVPNTSFLQVERCGTVSYTDAGVADPQGVTLDAGVTLDLFVREWLRCTGRRPEGYVGRAHAAGGSPVGRWLAEAATLEAASVPAFRRLASELEAHRAPSPLVRAARRAALDEIRHWRLMSCAARAHGARPNLASVKPLPVRPLFDVAAENVAEGCVRETFGAATAAYQARHARDPVLRALMSTIARDEARHGLLAWEIDRWARAALPAGAARDLCEHRWSAADEITREVAATNPPDPSLVSELGLPPPGALQRLADGATRLLWTEASA